MTTRFLLLGAIMMLGACSSATANSATSNISQLSSPQDDINVIQRLETEDKYVKIAKIAKNASEATVAPNNLYYKAKANVVHIPGSKQIKINIDDLLMTIKLIDGERSYLDFKKGSDYFNKFAEISFNYTYGIDFETAVQQIKVFKNTASEHGLLVFPDYTEEYPSYSILPFDSTGVKHSYTASIQSFDCADFDAIVLDAMVLDTIMLADANLDADTTSLDLEHNAAQALSISQKGQACKVNVYERKSIESLTVPTM